MEQIDNVLGLDWSEAQHAGDGGDGLDSSHSASAPSVAIRTDRGWDQHVILLEQDTFESLVRTGQAMLARQNNIRLLAGGVIHANPASGCEMYGCPPTCQYAGKPAAEPPTDPDDRDSGHTKSGK